MTHKPLAALLLALAAAPAVGPALAQEPAVLASWGDFSGSLPPEYAWDFTVTFTDDRRVTVEYCKGYAHEAPGCASVTRRLSKARAAEFAEKLGPLAAALAADPPQQTPDIPIGGGDLYGLVVVDGQRVEIPAFLADKDVPRGREVLTLLQEYTPDGAVDTAAARAKAPKG